ncbi:TetR family transcriptional regulator [Kitasatospora sp. NPDC086801]|uniref:acyl-CoA-like ligand-binding transcription factor n=1 Tax=Kitasatospora sp. NPDC086801 TaxID=3364066 RepID=UPI00381932E0
MTKSQTGLRERKKAATREALSWAALRLAVERGLGNVRVEDIAAAAGVSPRTYNNYFSSKAEAIVSRHCDRIRLVGEALRERPVTEPLWEALTRAALAPFDGAAEQPDPQWTTSVRLLLREPALQAELARAGADAETGLTAAVAARTGADPGGLHPRLVAAGVLAALKAASDVWLRADPPVPLQPLLAEALRQLAAGLPDPSSS